MNVASILGLTGVALDLVARLTKELREIEGSTIEITELGNELEASGQRLIEAMRKLELEDE